MAGKKKIPKTQKKEKGQKEVAMMKVENKKWIIFQLLLVVCPFIISSFIRLSVMNDFSLLILDFSSISFSFSLLSFIIAINVSGYKNLVTNSEQDIIMEERKVVDLLICYVASFIFAVLFVVIEYFQTQIMTNLSVKEKQPFSILIFFSIIAIAYFLIFSSNLRNRYKLKITL
jgi:hypothetical protein